MFINQTFNYIFYSAGKTGTQTLASIPNSNTLLPPSQIINGTRNIRKDAVTAMRRLMISDPRSNIAIIIRNPRSRFVSGMYEIIAKEIFGIMVVTQALMGTSVATVEENIEQFYKREFWDFALDKTLRLRPSHWEDQLDGYRWQFHVGNWLADVEQTLDTADQLGRAVDLVDITQLSAYLDHKGIEYQHLNKNDSMMWRLSTIPNFETVYSRVDHKLIQQSFNAGLDRINPKIKEMFDAYLEPESERYNRLTARLWK